jgi:ketosteroid isomerase-like protein
MKLVLALLAACSLSAPAFAENVSQEVLRDIADRFDTAQIEQDRAAIEAMTTDDLIFVGSNGVRQSRAEFIAGWMEPGTDYEPAVAEDRYFLPLGPDVGVAGGDVVLRGTANGQPFAARIRFADTFRRIDGVWKAVHIQATRVPAAQ